MGGWVWSHMLSETTGQKEDDGSITNKPDSNKERRNNVKCTILHDKQDVHRPANQNNVQERY